MKRRKHVQPSLFEPQARWSQLPPDTQQKVVEQLAQLCVSLQTWHACEATLTSAAVSHETETTQETHHDR